MHCMYDCMFISLGPLGSRAAKAIGFIEKMIEYSYVNAPLQKELLAGWHCLLFLWLHNSFDACFFRICLKELYAFNRWSREHSSVLSVSVGICNHWLNCVCWQRTQYNGTCSRQPYSIHINIFLLDVVQLLVRALPTLKFDSRFFGWIRRKMVASRYKNSGKMSS